MTGGRLVAVLLGLQLVRGLLYAGLIPLWQNPDEYVHFEYVKLLAERDRLRLDLPVGGTAAGRTLEWLGHREPGAGVGVTHSALRDAIAASLDRHAFRDLRFREVRLPPEADLFAVAGVDQLEQAPGYYVLAGAVLRRLRLESVEAEAYALRVLAVLLSLGVVAIAAGVGRELFPERPALALAVPAVVVFLPQYTALSAAIGNDKLAELAFAGVFWLAVRGIRRGFTGPRVAGIGALVAAGMLVKRNALILLPLLVLLWDLHRWAGRGRAWGRYALGRLGFAGLAVAGSLGALAWAGRPGAAGAGLLAWFDGMAGRYAGVALTRLAERLWYARRLLPQIARHLWADARILFWGFWGNFGHMEVRLADWVYFVLALVTLATLGGLWRAVAGSRCEPAGTGGRTDADERRGVRGEMGAGEPTGAGDPATASIPASPDGAGHGEPVGAGASMGAGGGAPGGARALGVPAGADRPGGLQAWQREALAFVSGAVVVTVGVLFLRDVLEFVVTEVYRYAQGRYLHPVVVPIAACLVAGLAHLHRGVGDRALIAGIVGGLALLDAVAVVGAVLPFFYGVTLGLR